MECTERLPSGAGVVGGECARPRSLEVTHDHGVDHGVEGLDAVDAAVQQLGRRQLAARHGVDRVAGGEGRGVHGPKLVADPELASVQTGGVPAFADRTVVVTGAATGIGAALAAALVDQGARVHALDIAPVVAEVTMAVQCDLGTAASIDAAVEVLPGEIHAVFNCAGVPNGGRFSAAEVMAVNWLGLRHLTEVVLPRMPRDSAVVHVASTAGRGWPAHETELRALLAAEDFAAGAAWVEAHAEVVGDGYAFSKEAVQWYTMVGALDSLREHGVRMNSICPGVTDTQLAQDFRRGVGDEVIDRAIEVAGRLAEPREMVGAMLFLADHAQASYVNGINLNVDRGTGAAHLTGQW